MNYYSLIMTYSGQTICYAVKADSEEGAFSKLQKVTNTANSIREYQIRLLDKEVNCLI